MEQNNYGGKLQQPAKSGFDRNSTAAEVMKGIDLTGKIAFVTGGHSGLGLETTKALTAAGARVTVPARDIEKAKKNLFGVSNVEIEQMELTDPASIDTFANKFLSSDRPLHLLFNNAGIMWVPLTRDARGYESQFATNHLGHFQLTARLWPALKKANGARVINTSSWGHHASPIIFDDINFEKQPYNAMIAYGQSKTANVLFAVELDNRGKSDGVRAYAVHPGLIVSTDLGRNIDTPTMKALGMIDEKGNYIHQEFKGVKSAEQGVSTQLWCGTSKLLNNIGGVYCENTDIALIDADYDPDNAWVEDMSKIKGVMPYALEEEAAKRLWTLSEEMTGAAFTW